MKLAESMLVKVPEFEDLEGAQITERDITSHLYSQATGLDILKKFILDPFGNAVKDIVLERAEQAVGVDSRGIVTGRYSDTIDLGKNGFYVDVQRHSGTPQTDGVMNDLEVVLTGFKEHNIDQKVRRDHIRKDGEEVYVAVDHLLDEIGRLKGTPKLPTTKRNLELRAAGTDELRVLDDSIKGLRVGMDPEAFKSVSIANGEQFYEARCIEKGIKGFANKFKLRALELYEDIRGGDMEKAKLVVYESGVRARFLPYTKTSIGNKGALDGLITKKPTNSPAASNGDISLVQDHAFEENYAKTGRGAIQIEMTELDGKPALRIYRPEKEGAEEERVYRVMQHGDNGRVYIHIDDVLESRKKLIEAKTTSTKEVKIDIFPGGPEYLVS